MDTYNNQTLLGISNFDVDLAQVDTLIVKKDLSVFGDSTLFNPTFPTGAALHKVLTCNTIQGDAVWQDPADAVLAGDCVGFGSSNRVDTLAGGTIPVSTLATLAGTQTLTNKTLTNPTVNNTISSASSSGLSLSSTGGTYGPSKITVQNIGGCNGLLLDTTGSSVQLTDVVCKSGTKAMNMRFEARTTDLRNALNSSYGEYQVLLNNSLSPVAYFGTAACGIAGSLNANAIDCTGLKVTTGAAVGSVLTSDATGNASWLAPAVTTSVGDLTMSGKLLDPLGKYLLARSGNSIFMGGAGMNIFNQNNLAIGNNACSTINAFGFCATGHIAIGNNSLLNSAGNYNCAVGLNSCLANTSGSNNCAVGTSALSTNLIGNNSTAMGHASGANITAGFNTCMGAYSDVSGGVTNATALGYQATCTANNTIQLGNSSVTAVNTSGEITTPSVVSTICSAVNYNAPGYRAPTVQGTYFTWNRGGGSGRACWGNQRGYGSGGHEWVEYDIGTGATTVLASLDNSGSFVTTGGITGGATTLASLTVNGNTLVQTLGVMSTISCQYGISCGSLSFPSGGATALSYFEEYNHTGTFLINTSESPSFTLKISKIGRTINCTILSSWTSASGVYSGPMTMFQAIPARFIPALSLNFSVLVFTGATPSMGYGTVTTGGLIQIQPPGGFSTGGSTVGYRATAFSYQVS